MKRKECDMLKRISQLLDLPIQMGRSIHINDSIVVYISTRYSTLTNTTSANVVVFNVYKEKEYKLGFYDPNLKEKIEATVTLLQ